MENLENKVIYQIYPKSFKDSNDDGVGDIGGIIEKLDYLKALGVDYLWLTPINRSLQYDNGYDIASYYDIDELFGTKDDYLLLIKEANKRGIKIMMDLVLNHTSTYHEWFLKALSGDSKYMDYYVFRDTPTPLDSIFGGSAWEYVSSLNMYYLHMFDVHQADLNWDNPLMRKEIYAMINYWIELGVEGFRLDVIGMIGKDIDKNIINYAPNFYKYLKEMNHKTFKNKILCVGECWGATIEEMSKMCNAEGLSEAFTFNHLTTNNINGDKFQRSKVDFIKIMDILKYWQDNYKGNEALVMNNHDQPRLISAWFDNPQYYKNQAKLLITIFGFLKGNLYIYQGEEIGMINAYEADIKKYNDIETLNKYAELIKQGYSDKEAMSFIMGVSRDNARIVMPWDDTINGGFSKHTPWLELNNRCEMINVAADLQSIDSIYRYYQAIISFRKSHEEELKKSFTYKIVDDVLIIDKGTYRIYANLSDNHKEIQATGSIIFKSNEEQLAPYGVVVYQV